MRRFLMMLLVLAAIHAVQAQAYMHIRLKSNERIDLKTDEIAYIDFSVAEKGALENPYTVAELLEACDGLAADAYLGDGKMVCTRGIVSRIKEVNTSYGNVTYYIGDTAMGGTSLYVYRGKLLNGARAINDKAIHVGDTVVVYGKVINFKGSTIEYAQDNYLVGYQQFNVTPSTEKMQAALARLEFPRSSDNGQSLVVLHEGRLNDRTGETGINYSIEWDNAKKAQRWSCYQMYASLLESNTSRTSSSYPNDFFLPDDMQFSADPYKSSGYDHGHICPSADRLSSEEVNAQTFFLSNMQPQTHSFNAGIWARMETQVRQWADIFDTLYVVKGGTIDADDQIITYISNESETIPVPRYFFMGLLGKSPTGYSALGFWVEHKDGYSTRVPLSDFVVNISDLQQLTGIDFFHNLPDDIEQEVENISSETLKNLWF
jgi:endonuclease G